MQDAKKKNRSLWLYGKIGRYDKLADVMAELLQEEPDYDSIVAELVGCTMSSCNSIDDNGSDFGDDYNVDSCQNFEH